MTNIELAEKINGYLKGSKAKAKKYEDLVAVNFTFIDDIDDLYIEVREGVLTVAPYHYDDLQANVTGAAENIDKLFSGEVSFDKALADGLVKVDGDVAKFKALEPLVPAKKAEKKSASAAKVAAPAAKPAAEKKAAPASKPAANANKSAPAAKKHGKK